MNLWSYLLERPLVEELGPSARRAARSAYQHDLSMALVSAGASHLLVLISAFLLASRFANREAEPPIVDTQTVIDLLPVVGKPKPQPPTPPRFRPQPPPNPQGVFVPVPEAQPDTSQAPLIPSAPDDGSLEMGPGGDGTGQGGVPGGEGFGGGGGGDGDGYPAITDRVIREVEPKLVEQPVPDYPDFAKMAQIQGRVLVRVLVGKDGKVKKAIVIDKAHPLLDEAALDAAERALFKPALQQGQPVPVWVNIPFRFTLH